MEKTNFKIIIVGGSIAGLTLAHCLERANIDHVVLEKRSEIYPQEGAFVGIWPNGARVLDQLGLYDDLEELTVPIHRMHIRFPDEFCFSSDLPKAINERFGYPIISIDRQKLLDILYNRYPDKSKIIPNKKVTEIKVDDGACAFTADGCVFKGDVIVGADGVHSRVRYEMHRQRATAPNTKGATVEYACVFGISSPIPGLDSGEHVNSYGEGTSVMTFHGKGGRVFWFITQKLERKSIYPDTPHFSTDDATEFCHRRANVRIWKDITVGHLWKNKLVVSMTALEEGLSRTWYSNRIVMLGDSIHKMTPNIGQGANTAIEDAAVLSSLVKRLSHLNAVSHPSDACILNVLREFQSLRYDRVQQTYKRSKFAVRFHTRDDLAKSLVGRYLFPHIGSFVAKSASKAIAGGDVIDFLPIPKRSGPIWTQHASNEKRTSPSQWALVCMTSVLICAVPIYVLVYMVPFL